MRDTHSHTHLEAPTEAEKPYTHLWTHWEAPTRWYSGRRLLYIAAILFMVLATAQTCNDPAWANIPDQVTYLTDVLNTSPEQQRFITRCMAVGGELTVTEESYVCIVQGDDED